MSQGHSEKRSCRQVLRIFGLKSGAIAALGALFYGGYLKKFEPGYGPKRQVRGRILPFLEEFKSKESEEPLTP